MKTRKSNLVAVLPWLCAAALSAQVPNDTCATATPIGSFPVLGTNVGATTGPNPLGSCQSAALDVWYSWTAPCGGTYTFSTCSGTTNFGTVVTVWDGTAGCGSLTELACSDVCSSGGFQGASTTLVVPAGHAYYVSVAGISGNTGVFLLSVSLGAAMTLQFISAGPGTIGYTINQGPGNGLAFVAVALNPGAFPLGWFYGVDISWFDLINQISTGYPFMVGLSPCGQATVGPFPGVPSGLHLYAVGLAAPAGSSTPTTSSAPTTGVVP